MKTNVGSVDRIIRFVLGLGLLSMVFTIEGSGRWWGLIGIVPLATALFRFCPAYTLLGMNTCPMSERGEK